MLACARFSEYPEAHVDPMVQSSVVFGEWRTGDDRGSLRVLVVVERTAEPSNTAYLQWLSTDWEGDVGFPGEPVDSVRLDEIDPSALVVSVTPRGVGLDPSQFEILVLDTNAEFASYCGSSRQLGSYQLDPGACEVDP